MKAKNRAAARVRRIGDKPTDRITPTRQRIGDAFHQTRFPRKSTSEWIIPSANHRLLLCVFGAALACFLVASAAAPRWAQAGNTSGQLATVVIQVEGYTGALPTLVAGTDFTLGQPVGTNPAYMADESGKQPLAKLIESKEAQGFTLKWHDEAGKEFDWLTTKIEKSTTVTGTFVEADYEVRVSFNDAKTDDLTVKVPRGSSFKQAYGSIPATPTKGGWEFVRWVDTSDDSTFDFTKPIEKSTSIYALFKIANTAEVEAFDPTKDIPKTLTGSCYIGATWSVHPAKFAISDFTGELKGYAGTGTCSLPSAAPPSNTRADYVATLKEVNVEAGEVVYDVNITPPGAARPGGPSNSLGLIGYQTVYLKAVIKKNFGGYLEVVKTSSNPSISEGNRCYSLEGAVFGVYNQEGSRVAQLTTGPDGKTAKSPLLPAGTYTIREETAPDGFAPAPDTSVAITSGSTTTASISDAPQNTLINLIGQKIDAETNTPYPLGSATLKGALFRVSYFDQGEQEPRALWGIPNRSSVNPSSQKTTKQSMDYLGTPKRTWVFKTDETGRFAFDENHFVEGDEFYYDTNHAIALPLGTVLVEEIQPPTGYLGCDAPWKVSLTSEGTEEHISAWTPLSFEEQVIRGDPAFTKAKSGTMEHLANVPFRITSHTTGEEHVLVTDENGMANTASSWVPHSRNTNAGTSAKDGIWFERDSHGGAAKVNDDLGALPYDTYEIEELPCKENEDTVLAHFTITISRDNTTLDLGTVDNDTIPLAISGEVDKRETLLNEAGSFDYSIDYRSTSSTWVDEFTMTDTITCAENGYAHLTGIATPVSFEDYDGMMNVWYRTNFDQEKEQEKAASEEDGKTGKTSGNSAAKQSKSKPGSIGEANTEASSASDEQPNACAGNPYNPDNPTNKRIHDFSGWRIWKQDISTLGSQELAVNDLSLEQGEFIIAVAFEHGRVEEGFGTNTQDAKEWERPERYENVDLSDLTANRVSFNLKEAAGPTRSEEDSMIAYAPAILHMQATEETLSGDAVDLWNVANIDTHRNLEIHDEDRDSVVQSTNPVETAAESVAAKLPKTNDGSAPVPLLVVLALATTFGLLAFPKLCRRYELRRAILNHL